ncbi:hypothetical protein [Saccharomonospora amisosensis]|uniref:hypothetical protein n=1 Tax=Saccharomonospora amisosensis TaxID=1128677 RepID=UPI00141DE1B8|nr:hypothetical protein [Saccharomonospora amisosensis]
MVDVGFVVGVGVVDGGADVAEFLDECVDVGVGQWFRLVGCGGGGEGLGAAGLDLGGPLGDEGGVGSGFEGFSVLVEFGVAFA